MLSFLNFINLILSQHLTVNSQMGIQLVDWLWNCDTLHLLMQTCSRMNSHWKWNWRCYQVIRFPSGTSCVKASVLVEVKKRENMFYLKVPQSVTLLSKSSSIWKETNEIGNQVNFYVQFNIFRVSDFFKRIKQINSSLKDYIVW